MNEVAKCKNCGLCCHPTFFNSENKPYIVKRIKCRYLINFMGITRCRIFKNRLGTDIVGKGYCSIRKLSKHDYPNCPLNTNKEIITVVEVKGAMKDDTNTES